MSTPDPQQRKKISHYIFVLWINVAILDYLNFAAIHFTYFIVGLYPATAVHLQPFINALINFAADSSIVYALIAWSAVHFDREKNGQLKNENLSRAALATLIAGLSLTMLVLGAALKPTTDTYKLAIGGLSFAVTMLYQVTAYFYYKQQATLRKNDAHLLDNDSLDKGSEEKPTSKPSRLQKLKDTISDYENSAMAHLIIAGTSSGFALASFFVVSLGMPLFALLGTTSSLLGAGFVTVLLSKKLETNWEEDKNNKGFTPGDIYANLHDKMTPKKKTTPSNEEKLGEDDTLDTRRASDGHTPQQQDLPSTLQQDEPPRSLSPGGGY
jgi:hypothetical protein